jgi:hypothetical protein
MCTIRLGRYSMRSDMIPETSYWSDEIIHRISCDVHFSVDDSEGKLLSESTARTFS